jgi:cytochrome bd-type quinol oxidase subunit 2
MNKKRVSNLTKWAILTISLMTLIAGFQLGTGLFTQFAESDITGICVLIWFVFILAVGWAGIVSLSEKPHMKRIAFLSQLCQMLGLLGTVMGMIYGLQLDELAKIDVSDKASIVEMMVNMATSISTCLTTTATGIIFSVFISLYPFIIKDYSDE